jgi:hypothetical protein
VADNFSVSTPHQGNCSLTQGFVLQLDSTFKTVSLKSGMEEVGDPYEIKFLKDGTYILSGVLVDNDYINVEPAAHIEQQIFINRYDAFNNLLSKQTYNKNPNGYSRLVDFNNFNPLLRVDSENNFILSDRYTDGFDSIANALTGPTLKTFLMKAPLNILKSIEVSEDEYPIEIFPNPANNRLNIKIWDQSNLQFNLQMVDALGRLVNIPAVNYENEVYFIDVSTYSPGLYFFIFDNKKQRITRKILIVH